MSSMIKNMFIQNKTYNWHGVKLDYIIKFKPIITIVALSMIRTVWNSYVFFVSYNFLNFHFKCPVFYIFMYYALKNLHHVDIWIYNFKLCS
jgi:hypothetical protein